jgi:flagellin-like hook-associated protein FlgL
MSRIIPIPTTRVSDYYVRSRLIEQVQLDQIALLRLQNQVSTGQRIQLPSEDSAAALRAINVQRLLDRKGQIRTNLEASSFYLGTAHSALDGVSNLLIKIRAEVVGVNSTLATEFDRQSLIKDIDTALQTILSAANSKSQGRYLFSGSRAQIQPYELNDKYVEYRGNTGALQSYVDVERLFDTNLTGPQVFGGVSASVEGSVDLNPHLTRNTLLSTINGGSGIGRNPAVTISINNGTSTLTSVVNLTGAVTLGDVARLLEAGVPEGTDLTVDITGTGLVLRTTSGTLRVGEVAGGQTARELRILTPPESVPTDTMIGGDLNPAETNTTRLSDLLGTKAYGRIVSAGLNNDILITAGTNGADFNDVVVEFVSGGVAGNEEVTFDSVTKTLTVKVQAGASTAAQVAASISAEGTFTAIVDSRDASSQAYAGSGQVEVANFGAITSGGSGEVLDTTSGLILTNGGKTVTLDTSSAQTVEDLLNLIHGTGLGLLAEINASGTGINVRSRLSGADFTIGENGGVLATQLGIRTYVGTTKLSEMNRGLGVPTSNDPSRDDLQITARDGTQLSINLSSARTVQDVIDLINNHTFNHSGTTSLLARLARTGNGIELVDSSSVVIGDLTVAAMNGSRAAEFFGFLPTGQTQISANSPDLNGNYVIQSADRHTLEADGVFNTLIRLRAALETGDLVQIGRSVERIDQDLARVNFARAELGIRLQNLDAINLRLQQENVELRSVLSQDLDVDLVEAISRLTAQQYALQASLRSAAGLLQLSLLDFI